MMTGRSRAGAAALVDAGHVQLGGVVRTKGSTKVTAGDAVEVELVPDTDAADIRPAPDLEVDIVYADEHLLVVDKPAGVVVHPGAGTRDATLIEGVLARFPEVESVGQPGRPGVVHRLDKGTSGLLLIARTDVAYAALVSSLRRRVVERRYRALVWGHPSASAGLIDAPVGRSAREPTRMAVAAGGKEARTRYEVLARYEQPVRVAELACGLETGRTHQIRVHMASIGHPVVGDARYGGVRESLSCPRPWLHAEHLALDHPVTGERLAFTSALPDDLRGVLSVLARDSRPM
jgi:23S rRNA pseudouridine1911/1915/1917 synthase